MNKNISKNTLAIKMNYLRVFILLLLHLTALVIVGCENDNPLNQDQNDPKLMCLETVSPKCDGSLEIISVPLDTISTNSLGFNCGLSIDPNQDINFVIRTITAYDSLISCDSIPTIDFEKCTLLAGQKVIHWCCSAKLVEQEVIKDCKSNEYKYRIVIHEPSEQWTSESTFYYFAITPKIENEFEVQFEVLVNEK